MCRFFIKFIFPYSRKHGLFLPPRIKDGGTAHHRCVAGTEEYFGGSAGETNRTTVNGSASRIWNGASVSRTASVSVSRMLNATVSRMLNATVSRMLNAIVSRTLNAGRTGTAVSGSIKDCAAANVRRAAGADARRRPYIDGTVFAGRRFRFAAVFLQTPNTPHPTGVKHRAFRAGPA